MTKTIDLQTSAGGLGGRKITRPKPRTTDTATNELKPQPAHLVASLAALAGALLIYVETAATSRRLTVAARRPVA